MCRPAHLLSHMSWFNRSPTSSTPNAASTKHDKHRCKPRHRKQVVQGHIKPQQSSCSPWKEPKDCKKVQHQTSTSLDNEEVHVVPWRFTPSNLHSILKFAQFLFVPSFRPDPSQTVCAIGLSKATVVRDKKKAWLQLQWKNHAYARVVMPITITKHCGHHDDWETDFQKPLRKFTFFPTSCKVQVSFADHQICRTGA